MRLRGRGVTGRSLFAAVVVILALSGREAPAATYAVSVTSNTFSPTHHQLAVGDTILWVWDSGPHNVTATSGATFSSGDRWANSTFTQTFSGGVIKYRCTNHSQILGGECEGMCGLLTERPLDFTPPNVSITRPVSGQVLVPTPRLQGGVVNSVTVEGEASDNIGVLGVLVRLYDPLGRASEQPAECNGCPDGVVQWKLDLNLLPGSYVVEARATDTSGNSRWSSRTTFYVL